MCVFYLYFFQWLGGIPWVMLPVLAAIFGFVALCTTVTTSLGFLLSKATHASNNYMGYCTLLSRCYSYTKDTCLRSNPETEDYVICLSSDDSEEAVPLNSCPLRHQLPLRHEQVPSNVSSAIISPRKIFQLAKNHTRISKLKLNSKHTDLKSKEQLDFEMAYIPKGTVDRCFVQPGMLSDTNCCFLSNPTPDLFHLDIVHY